MNILILNWRDTKHPLAGGAEQMVMEHAKYWLSQGNKITWFTSNYRSAKPTELINGIFVIRKGNHFTVIIWAFIYNLLGKFKDTDLIIDCFHFFPYFSKFYFRKSKVISIIQEVADNLWFENLIFPLAFVGFLLEKKILKSYRDLIFITGSKSAMKDLMNLGIDKSNLNVINHGLNKIKIKKIKKERDPTIIFLGRISKDKGIEDALTSIKLLSRDYKKIKFWIIGKSENKKYENRIKKIIVLYRLGSIVKRFGYVSEKEKFELLSKSWVLVHPSKKEGWGLNVIEANSVETPAVGYNVAGLSDSIKNNKTGLLVNPDAISLADGIEELITSKEKRFHMQKSAFEWSKKFTWDSSVKKSYKLIKSQI